MATVLKRFSLLSYQDAEMTLPLFEAENEASGSAVSVIIGPNGSSKSRALSRVIEELSFVHESREPRPNKRRQVPPSDHAVLDYIIDGQRCRMERRGQHVVALVDGEFRGVEDAPFPNRAMAISYLPTDKFRYSRSDDDDFYQYLGLRQATNLTTTGALESKVIESLLSGLAEDEEFSNRLAPWLALLGISPQMGLVLTLSNVDFLKDNFATFQREATHRLKRRRGLLRQLPVDLPHLLDQIWLFFSKLPEANWQKDPRGRGYEIALDLNTFISSQDDAKLWLQGIKAARDADILRGPFLLLDKGSTRVRFSDLSSGEQQIIGTNVRLLARLRPGSLIVIDEPEISLHPEWQIRYVPTLLKSLDQQHSSHVIIATHSHFMVSDLDQGSSLVSARQEAGPKFSFFDGDVYGRSPENILYRVFGVATSGNLYVEGDLHSALKMLSGRKEFDKDELGRIQARLGRVRSKDNPALELILEQIADATESA
ncbi:AAA family ATPase [Xanthomonas arboricola]|uniref:AAA family ATPase n=1 Tax=Xanthomonas arboricola TaxID=56448 RepID=UPI0012906EB8|nr:AAA family ATPase [Xanthomonas arboricola]